MRLNRWVAKESNCSLGNPSAMTGHDNDGPSCVFFVIAPIWLPHHYTATHDQLSLVNYSFFIGFFLLFQKKNKQNSYFALWMPDSERTEKHMCGAVVLVSTLLWKQYSGWIGDGRCTCAIKLRRPRSLFDRTDLSHRHHRNVPSFAFVQYNVPFLLVDLWTEWVPSSVPVCFCVCVCPLSSALHTDHRTRLA